MTILTINTLIFLLYLVRCEHTHEVTNEKFDLAIIIINTIIASSYLVRCEHSQEVVDGEFDLAEQP